MTVTNSFLEQFENYLNENIADQGAAEEDVRSNFLE